MALPIPTCPIAIPPMTEPRRGRLEDPDTSSSISDPENIIILDACDQPARRRVSSTLNVGQLGGASGCEKLQAASITIRGVIPECSTADDFALLVNYVRDVIATTLPTS